jgi:hypothetical protein
MFTSKQLYMMNGGNKMYIYKDGFGDVYDATPAEEALWAQEVVEKALRDVDAVENSVSLSCAIDNLRFHKYPGLKELLTDKMKDTSPPRQQAFEAGLQDVIRDENYTGYRSK